MTKTASETTLQIAVDGPAGGHDLAGFELAAKTGTSPATRRDAGIVLKPFGLA